jgi:peroxiredoxin (alkyl hydroperoxide reductase subunit C)
MEICFNMQNKVAEKHGDVCPANWAEGEEAMKPTAEGVAEYLAKHGK